MEQSSQWLPAVIGAVGTISGVALAWLLSFPFQKKSRRMEHLSIAFSDLFCGYMQFAASPTEEHRAFLLSYVERVRLFCSNAALKELDRFEHLLLYDNVDFTALGKQYSLLRKLSRKEMQR